MLEYLLEYMPAIALLIGGGIGVLLANKANKQAIRRENAYQKFKLESERLSLIKIALTKENSAEIIAEIRKVAPTPESSESESPSESSKAVTS